MFLMYIDESGNTGTNYKDKDQPFLTMSGVIVKDTDWIRIDSEITELKQKLFKSTDVEIHAALMYNPRKRTHFWGERSLVENLKSLESIVDFMVRSEIKLISCNISKQNIKNHLGGDMKVDPYYFGLIVLSYWFDMFLISDNSRGSIITDRIDSIDERITHSILNILRFTDEYNITNIIERPLKTDAKMSNLVQIADVAAFCFNKRISWRKKAKLSNKEQHMVEIAQKLDDICYTKDGIFEKRDIIISKFKNLVYDNVIKKMGE